MSSIPTVSIILPIYNAEACLEACLSSIRGQQLEDFEVWMIDDGSSDGSERIAGRYAEEDSRFHYVRQENQGAAAARNHGISLATGRYIQFVDSDDTVEPNFSEVLVRTMEKRSVDLTIADFNRLLLGETPVKGFCPGDRTMGRNSFLRMLTMNPMDYYYGVCWNKIFRRDILIRNDIRFTDRIRVGEDFLFVLDYLIFCSSVACVTDRVYNYSYGREDSLSATAKGPENKIRQRLMMYEGYRRFFDKADLHGIWRYRMRRYLYSAWYYNAVQYPAGHELRKLLWNRLIREQDVRYYEIAGFTVVRGIKRRVKRLLVRS